MTTHRRFGYANNLYAALPCCFRCKKNPVRSAPALSLGPIQAILRTSSGELRLCEREPHRFYDALGFTISFRQSPRLQSVVHIPQFRSTGLGLCLRGTAGDVFLLRQDSARDGKRAENRGLSWEENLKMGNESMGAPASCMSRWIGGEGLRKPGFHGSAP